MRGSLFALSLLVALSGSTAAQTPLGLFRDRRPPRLWTVNDAGGADFRTIQAAVDAAEEGDEILVASGTYTGFVIERKSLGIAVESGGIVRMTSFAPRIEIRDLLAQQAVWIRGFRLTSDSSLLQVRVEDARGNVWVEDCELGVYYGGAATVQSSDSVTWIGCDLISPVGLNPALAVLDSHVQVFDSLLRGGPGHVYIGAEGLPGGNGITLYGASTAFLSGCTLVGGMGDWCWGSGRAGDGGHGVELRDASVAAILDCALLPGVPGNQNFPPQCAPGLPGLPVSPPGSAFFLSGSAHRTTSPQSVVREGQDVTLGVVGVQGESPLLHFASGVAVVFHPNLNGFVLLRPPVIPDLSPLPTLGASGQGSRTLTAPPLWKGVRSERIVAQATFTDEASGRTTVGSATSLLLVDKSVPLLFDDCDGNGIEDVLDLVAGAPDCNANGIPDACDITLGTSIDCDGSGVPDECEIDCNGNGVHDSCDLASGTSQDANGNGIPDECVEDSDCNGNGVSDLVDILSGTSNDCDGNLIVDECDPDCDFDRLPDACDPPQLDCNGNGIEDACEPETVFQLNTTSIPAPNGLIATDGEWVAAVTRQGLPTLYTFRRAPGAGWLLTQALQISEQPGEIAIDDGTIVMGNSSSSLFSGFAGAVRVFALDAGGQWSLVQTLVGQSPTLRNRFGDDVDVDGDRLIVGAPGEPNAGQQPGSLYVFERDVSGQWTQVQRLVRTAGFPNTDFGKRAALSGDRLVVVTEGGSFFNYPTLVHIYELMPNGMWMETHSESIEFLTNFFQIDVDIDGDLAGWSSSTIGETRLLRRDPSSGAWAEAAFFRKPFGSSMLFGGLLALDADRAAVTSFDSVANHRQTFVFQGATGGPWSLLSTVGDNGFGWAAMSGPFVAFTMPMGFGIYVIDCNGNSIPDACDIASGLLSDSDGDGIPDACD